MTMHRCRAFILLVGLLTASSAALTACAGYELASTYRQDVETVHVPLFDNTTFFYDLEVDLTDAIVKEINRTTPWRATSSAAADTTLSGSITDAELANLTTANESGFVQESAYELAVAFEWRRGGTGEVLVARRNFRVAEPFVPARGANERIEVGQAAAIDRLARDIVAELRESW
jgi:hypothetical protein